MQSFSEFSEGVAVFVDSREDGHFIHTFRNVF
jgi:hypothetical protein